MPLPNLASCTERSRFRQLAMMAVVIGLGLFLRSRYCGLPAPVEKWGGDALWALVVYLGFGTLFVRWSIGRVAALALAFAFGIEFLQLYHAPWIDAIRSTRLGLLLLGSTFHGPDLIAYAGGIALGVAFEMATLRARTAPDS